MSSERRKSAVFNYFKHVPNPNSSAKPQNQRSRHFACEYCNWKTVINATRMTLHLVNRCEACPQFVRNLMAIDGNKVVDDLPSVKKERKIWKRISPKQTDHKIVPTGNKIMIENVYDGEMVQELIIHRLENTEKSSSLSPNHYEEYVIDSDNEDSKIICEPEEDNRSRDSLSYFEASESPSSPAQDIEANIKETNSLDLETKSSITIAELLEQQEQQNQPLEQTSLQLQTNSTAVDDAFFTALRSMMSELRPQLKLELKRKLFNLTADYQMKQLENE